MLVTAATTAIGAARRSNSSHNSFHGSKDNPSSQQQTVTASHAMMFPVFGSLLLVVLYLLWAYVGYIFLIYTLIVAVAALAFAMLPLCNAVSRQLGRDNRPRSFTFTAVLSVGLVLLWAITGSWVLNNVIGIAMVVAIVAAIRLPNLKVASIILGGLLVYDVYWVFLSHLHFGESVMVAVAKQQASNPAHDVAAALPVIKDLPPAWRPPRHLDMPNKLMFPVYDLWTTAEINAVLGARAADATPVAIEAEAAAKTKANAEAEAKALMPGEGIQIVKVTTPGKGSDAGEHPEDANGRVASNSASVLHWVLIGFMMLGLGDLALPALLISLAQRMDLEKRIEERESKAVIEAAAADAVEAAVVVASEGTIAPSTAAAPEIRSRTALILSDGARAGRSASNSDPDVDVAVPVKRLPHAVWTWLSAEAYDTFGAPSYLRTASVGYVVGLAASLLISRVFHAAQPALLYLVPSTLLPVIYRAYTSSSNDLRTLWRGHRDGTEQDSSSANN